MTDTSTRRPVRPQAAAGLILLRGGAHAPEVFLGRRAPGSRFMPDVFVVPGGRLDPGDARPSGFAERLPDPPAGLDRATSQRRHAFARCALREAYEEAGLLLPVQPAPPAPTRVRDVWAAYREAGCAPDFTALRLVARALTPTDSPIRFDTRFWLADGRRAVRVAEGDGELREIGWVPVAEVARLPLPEATALALQAAVGQYRRRAEDVPAAPFQRFLWRVGPGGARRIATSPLRSA